MRIKIRLVYRQLIVEIQAYATTRKFHSAELMWGLKHPVMDLFNFKTRDVDQRTALSGALPVTTMGI